MFGFVRGVRGRAVAVVLVAAGLLGGVAAGSVAAATKTTVTWEVSSLTAGQVKSLSAIASSNSTGFKTWSKTGSCTLSPKSQPTKLTMGTGSSCTLTLKIAKTSKYPAKTSTKIITRKSPTTTTTTVAPTTTTLAPVLYNVGDTGPGGGFIFYKDLTRAAGSQYFEVACAGWSDGTCGGSDLTDPRFTWGCYGTSISGAVGTAMGTGEQNTNNIVSGCATAGIAAKVADALVLGGQSDWFVPSKNELNALCKWAYGDTVNAVCNDEGDDSLSLTYGGFSPDVYWSSSEHTTGNVWFWYFYYGGYATTVKSYAAYVRPVRAF